MNISLRPKDEHKYPAKRAGVSTSVKGPDNTATTGRDQLMETARVRVRARVWDGIFAFPVIQSEGISRLRTGTY